MGSENGDINAVTNLDLVLRGTDAKFNSPDSRVRKQTFNANVHAGTALDWSFKL